MGNPTFFPPGKDYNIMAIQERTVKNKRNSSGELTGKARIVYDVNIKYKSEGKSKTYSRKRLPTKREAKQHEAQAYMTDWLERHGEANLRPSTRSSYQSQMKNHIFPYIEDIFLNQLSLAMLDDLYRRLSETGLSQTSVKYVHRIMGVSMEHARKYHFVESNPARDTITRFGKQGKTLAPYTVEQMRTLLASVTGTDWEFITILGGLYGLRLGEILGLRWHNVDFELVLYPESN